MKPQSSQRITLSPQVGGSAYWRETLKEYPVKDIAKKIISRIPIYREDLFLTMTRSFRISD